MPDPPPGNDRPPAASCGWSHAARTVWCAGAAVALSGVAGPDSPRDGADRELSALFAARDLYAPQATPHPAGLRPFVLASLSLHSSSPSFLATLCVRPGRVPQYSRPPRWIPLRGKRDSPRLASRQECAGAAAPGARPPAGPGARGGGGEGGGGGGGR